MTTHSSMEAILRANEIENPLAARLIHATAGLISFVMLHGQSQDDLDKGMDMVSRLAVAAGVDPQAVNEVLEAGVADWKAGT